MKGLASIDTPSAHPDDDQLVQMAQRDPAHFDLLYERYFERVYRFCLRRVSDPQTAEDLCSQIFIKVLDNLHSYSGGVFAAWLFRIAHNSVVSHYRQQKPHVPLDDVPMPDGSNASTQVAERLFVVEILQSLNDEEAELLALRIDADMSAEEIGAQLGKSANAVRVQIHRLLQRLRARFGDSPSGGEG